MFQIPFVWYSHFCKFKHFRFYGGNYSRWVLNTSDLDICHHTVTKVGEWNSHVRVDFCAEREYSFHCLSFFCTKRSAGNRSYRIKRTVVFVATFLYVILQAMLSCCGMELLLLATVTRMLKRNKSVLIKEQDWLLRLSWMPRWILMFVFFFVCFTGLSFKIQFVFTQQVSCMISLA